MKKGIWAYIASGILVLVAVVGLLLLLLLPKNAPNPIEPVNVYVEDITLEIGETRTDFYQVSVEEYEILFETDSANIIDIDENQILAKESGSVNVKIKVKVGENVLEETFMVTVLAPRFSYQLTNMVNCAIQDDNLELSSPNAQFKIKIFDGEGVEVQNPTISFEESEGIQVAYEFKVFKISATRAGVIKFKVAQNDFEFSINIIV